MPLTTSLKHRQFFVCIFIVVGSVNFVASRASGQASSSTGSANSSKLFIHGGGRIPKALTNEFLKMAGGRKAKLVVIPTATADKYVPKEKKTKESWRKLGFKNVTQRHTRKRKTSNSAEFLAAVESATAIWFSGGDQNRLSRAYVGTKLESALNTALGKGAVIGGSSAGAAIQSRVMIGGGDSEPKINNGFDLLPNAILDQHFLVRSRMNRLINAVRKHPARVGVGISEGTVLVVDGDNARVIGDSYVVIVRIINEKLDIQTLGPNSTFKLSEMGMVR